MIRTLVDNTAGGGGLNNPRTNDVGHGKPSAADANNGNRETAESSGRSNDPNSVPSETPTEVQENAGQDHAIDVNVTDPMAEGVARATSFSDLVVGQDRQAPAHGVIVAGNQGEDPANPKPSGDASSGQPPKATPSPKASLNAAEWAAVHFVGRGDGKPIKPNLQSNGNVNNSPPQANKILPNLSPQSSSAEPSAQQAAMPPNDKMVVIPPASANGLASKKMNSGEPISQQGALTSKDNIVVVSSASTAASANGPMATKTKFEASLFNLAQSHGEIELMTDGSAVEKDSSKIVFNGSYIGKQLSTSIVKTLDDGLQQAATATKSPNVQSGPAKRIQSLTIQLYPQDLGKLNVELVLQNDKLDIHIIAEKRQTANALTKDKLGLKELLSVDGYKVNDVRIEFQNSDAFDRAARSSSGDNASSQNLSSNSFEQSEQRRRSDKSDTANDGAFQNDNANSNDSASASLDQVREDQDSRSLYI